LSPSDGLAGGQVFAREHGQRRVRVGHDLGDDDAARVGAEFLRHRLGADERDVVERAGEAGLAGRADERGARLVGADLDDRIGLLRDEGLDGRIDVDGVALDGAEADRLEPERLHRPRHALEAGLAVGVVLIEDADPLDADRGQLLDDLGGLVEVRRADVEGIAVERRAQGLGAGERRDPWHLGRGRDRQRDQAGRRADVAEQREHAAVDQLPGVLGAAVRLVAVVDAAQLDRPPVDAAPSIDPFEQQVRADLELFAERARRAR
jgi:hypothetical protein